jgi:hypothetical protein
MALHGWWEGCADLGKAELSVLKGGANTNSMYDTSAKAYDPIVTAMSSQTLVQVRKDAAVAANVEKHEPHTGAVKG